MHADILIDLRARRTDRRLTYRVPESIRDAIAETKGFAGATGTISINAERNPDKPVVMVQIKGGKFTYHSTVDSKAAQ